MTPDLRGWHTRQSSKEPQAPVLCGSRIVFLKEGKSLENILERRVRRRPDLAFRAIDGDAWVLSTKDSSLHRLNATAAHLWALLDTEPTVASLGASLAEAFEVDEARALADALAFTVTLRERGLVELVGGER